jgi:hypothetical protein
MDLRDMLRSESMRFTQEELLMWGDDVELVACSDGRLTLLLEQMRKRMVEGNQQRVRIRRILGAALDEDTINAIVESGSLKGNRSVVILSHDGCAMAKAISEGLKRRSEGPGEAYRIIFHALKAQRCEEARDVERAIPIISAARLEEVCKEKRLGKKLIVPDSMETPKIDPAPSSKRTLIVTSVMTCSYEDLKLDPSSIAFYYQQNDLKAVKAQVILSWKELGLVNPVVLVSQNIEEDPEIVQIHAKLKEDRDIKMHGVRMAEPELARSRVGQRHAPRVPYQSTSISPSASPQKRNRMSR